MNPIIVRDWLTLVGAPFCCEDNVLCQGPTVRFSYRCACEPDCGTWACARYVGRHVVRLVIFLDVNMFLRTKMDRWVEWRLPRLRLVDRRQHKITRNMITWNIYAGKRSPGGNGPPARYTCMRWFRNGGCGWLVTLGCILIGSHGRALTNKGQNLSIDDPLKFIENVFNFSKLYTIKVSSRMKTVWYDMGWVWFLKPIGQAFPQTPLV